MGGINGIIVFCLIVLVLITAIVIKNAKHILNDSKKTEIYNEDVNKVDTREKEFLHLFVIVRHGARTPNTLSNLYNQHSKFNKYPAGSLTKLGSMQSFVFGRILRDHYSSFLENVNFENKNLSMSYSCKERVRLSSEFLLDGFFSNYR